MKKWKLLNKQIEKIKYFLNKYKKQKKWNNLNKKLDII